MATMMGVGASPGDVLATPPVMLRTGGEMVRSGGLGVGPTSWTNAVGRMEAGMCIKCLNAEDTVHLDQVYERHELVKYEVPACFCNVCITPHLRGGCLGGPTVAVCVHALVKSWFPHCFDSHVPVSSLVLPRKAVEATTAQWMAWADADPKGVMAQFSYIASRATDGMADKLRGIDQPWAVRLSLTGLRLSIIVGYHMVFNTARCRISPVRASLSTRSNGGGLALSIPPGGSPSEPTGGMGAGGPPPAPPAGPASPADPAAPLPLPHASFGEALTGYTLTLPLPKHGEEVALPDGTSFRVDTIAAMHPKAQRAMLQAEVLKMTRDVAEHIGASKVWGDGEYVLETQPVAVRMLPGRTDKPVFIAAANLANTFAAGTMRHFVEKAPIASKDLRALEEIASALDEHLREGLRRTVKSSKQKDGRLRAAPNLPDPSKSPELAALLKQFEMDLTSAMSGKWTDSRRQAAFESMVHDLVADQLTSKASKANVKPNEALTKKKPRLIISDGDRGVSIQLAGPGILEGCVFSQDEFKTRSVKGTSSGGLEQRYAQLAETLEDPDDWYCVSLDYGAFDGSVRLKVRKVVENRLCRIATEIVEKYSPAHAKACNTQRDAVVRIMRGLGFTMVSTDMIRCSGDRGTSVLNYLTSLCVMIFIMWKLETYWGLTTETPKQYATRILRAWRDGKKARWQFVGEGDDTWLWLHRSILAARDKAVTQENKAVTVRLLVEHALLLGFQLEPQTQAGRVDPEGPDHDVAQCVQPLIGGRHEFVSRIFFFYVESSKIKCLSYGKCSKALDSLTTSFNLPPMGGNERDVWRLLSEKALAISANFVHCRPMFCLLTAVSEAAAAHGSLVTSEGIIASAGWKAFEFRNLGVDSVEEFRDRLKRISDSLVGSVAYQISSFENEVQSSCADRVLRFAESIKTMDKVELLLKWQEFRDTTF